MRFSFSLLGRFIPFKRTPGETWGGKQRKIPRLTHARKRAFMDGLLLTQHNEKILNNPYISAEVQSATYDKELAACVRADDRVFLDIDRAKFHRRFPSRKYEETWTHIYRTKSFPDV